MTEHNEEKKYQTIYADPPWKETGGGKIKRGADRHYPLMSVDDILEYMKDIPIAENAHMYLWVTDKFLFKSLKIIEGLGFRYVRTLVWCKDRFGLGQYYRGQHEICLFCVKGKLPYKTQDNATRSRSCESSVVQAKRRKHSQKPDEFYDKIEKVSYGPYLEVFARNAHEGWDCIGNEAPTEESQ